MSNNCHDPEEYLRRNCPPEFQEALKSELAQAVGSVLIVTTEDHHVGDVGQMLTVRMAANAIWNKLNEVMLCINAPTCNQQALGALLAAREIADSLVNHPRSGDKH